MTELKNLFTKRTYILTEINDICESNKLTITEHSDKDFPYISISEGGSSLLRFIVVGNTPVGESIDWVYILAWTHWDEEPVKSAETVIFESLTNKVNLLNTREDTKLTVKYDSSVSNFINIKNGDTGLWSGSMYNGLTVLAMFESGILFNKKKLVELVKASEASKVSEN